MGELSRRQDTEDHGEGHHVDDCRRECSQDRRPWNVAIGIAHLRGGDRGDLDTEVAEQCDSHPAADRADGALAADVPRLVVRTLDVEEADDRHEHERGELQDRRPYLDRTHVLYARQIDHRRQPQANEH